MSLLEELAPVFARRSTHRLFMVLACGLILADRGTVTGMAAAAGIAGISGGGPAGCSPRPGLGPGRARPGGGAADREAPAQIEGDPLIVAVDGTFFSEMGKAAWSEARWAYDGAGAGREEDSRSGTPG